MNHRPYLFLSAVVLSLAGAAIAQPHGPAPRGG